MGPRPHLWFSAFKTACLASELQVPVGPRPRLWFLHSKQRILDQNNKSLRAQTWPFVLCMYESMISARITRLYLFPAFICGFWMQNSDLWTGITSLYGSQTWPVVLCIYNSVISTRITRLYRFQPSSVVLCVQNSNLMTTIACVYGSQTSPVIFCMQNSVPSIRITSVSGS